MSALSSFPKQFHTGFCVSVGIAVLVLSGCASVAPPYQATNDNVRAIQVLPGSKVAVGEFKAQKESLNHLTIRGGSFDSPYSASFAEYLKTALVLELQSAGKLDSSSKVIITGELISNNLDAAIGTGTASISARIVVMRADEKTFDKVVSVENQWESSFVGAIAIPLARQNYGDTVKKLISKLVTDSDFQKAL